VIHSSASSRGKRRLGTAATAAVAALLTLLLTATVALSWDGSVPPPPDSPTSADQIQNLDQVKTAIKAYYGDTTTGQLDPVAGTTTLHTFSPTGAYANEMANLEADAAQFLAKEAKPKHHKSSPRPAVVLDVDDTTLNTYSYEIYSSFVYTPTTNATFVNNAVFPAVPGMPALVTQAQAEGYTIFFLTGRPETQRPGTTTNLVNAGYPPVPAEDLYLKDQVNQPWLSSCSPACSTTQYKSLTRQHIESLGYDIVANFGDQFSDLNGGFADRTFKVPNPMYFLP
jgi:HAD superfamily, subfamily IIIB (Acid phosphatase)